MTEEKILHGCLNEDVTSASHRQIHVAFDEELQAGMLRYQEHLKAQGNVNWERVDAFPVFSFIEWANDQRDPVHGVLDEALADFLSSALSEGAQLETRLPSRCNIGDIIRWNKWAVENVA